MTAPYFAPGSGMAPVQPSSNAKAKLDEFIRSWDLEQSLTKETLNTLVKSGLADTLQQITGPHQFTAPERKPGFWSNGAWVTRQGDDILASNLGRNKGGITRIVFNPQYLRTEALDTKEANSIQSSKPPLKLDDPQTNLMQILAHEIGHTAESMPGLFVDSTDMFGHTRNSPNVEKTLLGNPSMSRRMTLYQQWQQQVASNPASADLGTSVNRYGWYDAQGNFSPQGPELFADSFARATRLLRTSWDSKDARKIVRELPDLEKENPGVIYLLKWFTTQPAYEQHPIGKILRLVQPLVK